MVLSFLFLLFSFLFPCYPFFPFSFPFLTSLPPLMSSFLLFSLRSLSPLSYSLVSPILSSLLFFPSPFRFNSHLSSSLLFSRLLFPFLSFLDHFLSRHQNEKKKKDKKECRMPRDRIFTSLMFILISFC